MRFEYLIGVRYLRARRRQRFVSLIAVISLVGVMIGTFALTVVLSVMSGFQEDLRDRLLSFNPHITVEHTGLETGDLTALKGRIAALPGVVGVAPFISSQVMMVSTIESGAGSVDVSARPAFPSTVSTSGNRRIMRSSTCMSCCA